MAEQFEFFGVLSPDARRAALGRTRVVRARKGQTVLGHGVRSTEVFFVDDGQLQVVLYAADGREVSLRDLGPGQMFGEMAAIDGESRSASIVAQTDSRLLAIAQTDFRAAVETDPAVAAWLNRHLTGQIRVLTERIFELSALNVQARLLCELLRLARAAGSQSGVAKLSPAPTHAALAARIGTHREAVTREMAALAARGIVKAGRRSLEFIDLDGLEAAVRRLGADAPDQSQED